MKGNHNAHYSYWQLILTVWGNKPNHVITNDYYCYLLYGNAEKPGPSVPDACQKYCPWKSMWCWKAVVITSMAITEICVPFSECNDWPERKQFYFQILFSFDTLRSISIHAMLTFAPQLLCFWWSQCCHQEQQDLLLEVISPVPLGL